MERLTVADVSQWNHKKEVKLLENFFLASCPINGNLLCKGRLTNSWSSVNENSVWIRLSSIPFKNVAVVCEFVLLYSTRPLVISKPAQLGINFVDVNGVVRVPRSDFNLAQVVVQCTQTT